MKIHEGAVAALMMVCTQNDHESNIRFAGATTAGKRSQVASVHPLLRVQSLREIDDSDGGLTAKRGDHLLRNQQRDAFLRFVGGGADMRGDNNAGVVEQRVIGR